MNVFFSNALGGGFKEPCEVREGTTILTLFREKMGGSADPSNYLIRVNGVRPQSTQALRADDEVEVLPSKVSGA